MQKVTDWLALWRELSERQEIAWKEKKSKDREDVWREKASYFDAQVKRRWVTPDSSRDFVSAQLQANVDWTALDVGGGTGAWAVLMARQACRVTVVEPSQAMIEVMQRNLEEAGLSNVEIVNGRWPEAKVGKHDLTFCSHAMYGFSDFEGFIRSIESVTRHMCVLVMRAPTPDDLLGIISMHIFGQPYDSPDFQVAYNALLQMGIFPNVLMEDSGLWEPWVSPSVEDAIAEVKKKLGLQENSEHDEFIKDLMSRKLTLQQDGKYAWPRSLRSVLVYWDVKR
jgi:precorrin-6B methylase 2